MGHPSQVVEPLRPSKSSCWSCAPIKVKLFFHCSLSKSGCGSWHPFESRCYSCGPINADLMILCTHQSQVVDSLHPSKPSWWSWASSQNKELILGIHTILHPNIAWWFFFKLVVCSPASVVKSWSPDNGMRCVLATVTCCITAGYLHLGKRALSHALSSGTISMPQPLVKHSPRYKSNPVL